MRRMHSAQLAPRVKVHAYVEGLTVYPKPAGFAVIIPSGKTGGLKRTSLIQRIRALERFVATEECKYVPQLGEVVYVDWLHKPGNDVGEWEDPVFLGPVGNIGL